MTPPRRTIVRRLTCVLSTTSPDVASRRLGYFRGPERRQPGVYGPVRGQKSSGVFLGPVVLVRRTRQPAAYIGTLPEGHAPGSSTPRVRRGLDCWSASPEAATRVRESTSRRPWSERGRKRIGAPCPRALKPRVDPHGKQEDRIAGRYLSSRTVDIEQGKESCPARTMVCFPSCFRALPPGQGGFGPRRGCSFAPNRWKPHLLAAAGVEGLLDRLDAPAPVLFPRDDVGALPGGRTGVHSPIQKEARSFLFLTNFLLPGSGLDRSRSNLRTCGDYGLGFVRATGASSGCMSGRRARTDKSARPENASYSEY